MGVLFTVLVGLAVVTALALLASIGGWYYALTEYRERMGERSYRLLKFAMPPFLLASASPLVDLVVWQAGGGFPTIGFPGVVVGLVGSGAVVGYVLFDVRGRIRSGAAAAD